MAVHLDRIHVTNYRSCKSTTLNLHRNLSSLIGPNGSGKSNLLNAILLLNKISRPSRGRGDEELLLSGCKLQATIDVQGKLVKYEALVQYATSERNIDEVVTTRERWNLLEITGQKKWYKIPLSATQRQLGLLEYQAPSKRLSPRYRNAVLLHYSHMMGVGIEDPQHLQIVFDALERIAAFFNGITYYSASRFTDPSKCPASFELQNDRLSRRHTRFGEEHVYFLYDLFSAFKTNKNEFAEFLSLVGNEGIGLVETVKFTEIDAPSSDYEVLAGGRLIKRELKRLLVIPSFVIHGTALSPNQLSEGTFKTLAILFYIITDKSRLLLLEEPEVCIHHGLLSSIMEIIKDFSRKKQIVISTHSDAVLDALDPENVFLVKNDPERGTLARHVPGALSRRDYLALRQYLAEYGNLGEYWRHGDLEK